MQDKTALIRHISHNETHYYIDLDDSTEFVLAKDYKYHPVQGDRVTLHIVNGSEVRGVTVNDREIYYKSDEQLEQERVEWLSNYDKKKQQSFENNKHNMDADYASLPRCFQKRIDRFRANNPKFRIDYEGYELFCCKEAVKIAEACGTADKVTEFLHLTWHEQKEMAGISNEHSGNTIGCAIRLAYWYLSDANKVPQIHGSLSPLVGSKAFGDVPVVNVEVD